MGGAGKRWRARGAALVELALIAPVWVALAWTGVWLTELVRGRVQAQEAVRALAWDLAGAPLGGWESSREGGGEDSSAARTAAEARIREQAPVGAGITAWTTSLSASSLPLRFPELPSPSPVGEASAGTAAAGALLARGTTAALQGWGFGGEARVEAKVEAHLENPFPIPWPVPGQDALQRVTLHARASLWVEDGHLEDGGDVRAHHAGADPRVPALTRQVQRLTFLGRPDVASDLEARVRALPLVRGPLPSLQGTFVVSHAYRLAEAPAPAPGCDGVPGYSAAAGGESGVRDFMSPTASWLDHRHPQCFDTAPFRDVHAYPRGGASAGNLSMQIFQARGRHFMGCRQAGASDPSSSRRGADGCEGS